MNKYNGYNNFATWRVAHDILNHHQWDGSEEVTIDYLKELVDNAVFDNTGVTTNSLLASYARITLNGVDWAELADLYLKECKQKTIE
jgi:hypothetical protein